MRKITLFLYIIILAGFCSCLSYYQRNIKFNQAFENAQYPEAEKILTKDKKAENRKNKLLYWLNMGVVNSLQGKYKESNDYFEKAFQFTEEFHFKVTQEALGLLINPNFVDYKGEDFEVLLIHYYKAINYIFLDDKESALVECRRTYNGLNKLNDKYKSDNRFKRDAFMYTIMGLIFQSNGEFNDAFVSYRNAYDTYKDDYARFFSSSVPLQLKKDLLRTAAKAGMPDMVDFYEKEFGLKYDPTEYNNDKGELILFWNNGLGPVKAEWSINFTIVRGQGGQVNFVNNDLNLSFPFILTNNSSSNNNLSDLEFIRVAFPKYVERPLLFNSAEITYNGTTAQLYPAQDLNAIAFKSLKDRMLVDFGKALLRVASKKAAEYQARKENPYAGAALGVLGAISEKADTRNWMTIPHTIYYTRMQLPVSCKAISMNISGDQSKTFDIAIKISKGKTTFVSTNTPNFKSQYQYY